MKNKLQRISLTNVPITFTAWHKRTTQSHDRLGAMDESLHVTIWRKPIELMHIRSLDYASYTSYDILIVSNYIRIIGISIYNFYPCIMLRNYNIYYIVILIIVTHAVRKLYEIKIMITANRFVLNENKTKSRQQLHGGISLLWTTFLVFRLKQNF